MLNLGQDRSGRDRRQWISDRHVISGHAHQQACASQQ